mgnify:CR=1 FL=1
MKLIQPEKCVTDQKCTHFIPPIIKNQTFTGESIVAVYLDEDLAKKRIIKLKTQNKNDKVIFKLFSFPVST